MVSMVLGRRLRGIAIMVLCRDCGNDNEEKAKKNEIALNDKASQSELFENVLPRVHAFLPDDAGSTLAGIASSASI
jgi:hypothetical protein